MNQMDLCIMLRIETSGIVSLVWGHCLPRGEPKHTNIINNGKCLQVRATSSPSKAHSSVLWSVIFSAPPQGPPNLVTILLPDCKKGQTRNYT
ncbi:uncharacterized protein Dvir_GJ25966 [Drosophila virilis]|uniref:Uncharacterized protein n=1 Tax=Drosophila virilis TaxID=7244 RepID=A0A0Q9WLK1_DROVI|nr:uncharacterized protein Dvir_GJ25966 [Drosophila virilis]